VFLWRGSSEFDKGYFVGRKRITGGVEEGKGIVEVVSVVCV
jgi:hypothetical protein